MAAKNRGVGVQGLGLGFRVGGGGGLRGFGMGFVGPGRGENRPQGSP